MKKQDFITIMNKIIENEKKTNMLEDAIAVLSPDTYPPIINFHTSLPFEILNIVMNDKSDWIGYWYYELNKGKDYKKDTVTDNGKEIKLKTLGDLYNILNNNI